LQFIFVIHVARRICQGNRLSGSLDGVKNTPTLSHLFFTRSQLSPYISRFASGYRLMLVLSVLFAFSMTASFAQTAGDYRSAGTGDWKTLATWERFNGTSWGTPTIEGWPGQLAGTGAVNIQVGHIVTISNSGISTLLMGTLTISGTLDLEGDNTAGGINFSLNTQKVVVIQNLTPTPATIFFNLKSNLRLPVTAIISVGANGLSGTCSHNASIYFDTLQFYTCAGGGPCGTFQNLMDNGGNPTITLTSGNGTNIQTVCFNTPITPITYVVGNGASGANRTGTLPAGLTGIYTAANSTFTISGTPTASGTFNYTITTTGPGTCTNATATGTITVTLPPPNPVITFIMFSPTYTMTVNTTCGTLADVGQNDLDILSGDPGGSATYQWQVSYDGGATWVNAPGPTSTSTQYKLDPLYTIYESVAGVYFFRLIITDNLCSGTSNSITLTITKNSTLSAGVISGNQIFCISGNPAAFTEVTGPSGALGFGSYTYQWQSSTDNIAFTDITGANSPTYDPPAGISQTTYYRRVVVSGGCSKISNPITVLVNPLPTITGDFSVCSIGSTTQLTGSGTATSWVSASPAIATVSNTGLVSGVAAGTSLITYNDNNGCSTSETISVRVPPTTTGVTICPGGSGSLTSSFACPAGDPVTIGSKNASTGINLPVAFNDGWTNAGNITTVGPPYATVNLNPFNTSDYLQGTGYGFAIPSGATINGITVIINRQSSGTISPLIRDSRVSLVKAGTVQATNKAETLTNWTNNGVFGTATYGGGTDLWATLWTPTDINAFNFGVILSATNSNNVYSRNADVDYMQISVTYTLPGTLDWYTVSSGGTKIGSGSLFNPVGVLNSNLPDTNTPAATTYYAECSTAPGCRTATDYIITPSLPASVIIAADPSGAICAGTSVTFTATPTNGGTTPTYIWKKGGVVIPSETSATYTSTTLADNDEITVEMTSNAPCATGSPVTSNKIAITVTPPVGTPVFALGTSSSRNQGVETITYKAIANNSTGITYTLSPASAGTFIESGAGLAVTYSSLWNGTCTITATATGCEGSKSEIHTVSTNWCYALFTVNGALSCAGASSIDGHIGTLVGAITGFTPPGLIPPGYSGPGILSPSSRLDPQATTNSVQAAAQVVTAYNDLAAMPCSADPPLGTTLAADQTFTPKVYCTGGALTINTNVKITLDGAGIYIFKVNGALTTDIGSIIEVKNGADYRNVYWQVAGAVVLSGDVFIGTIINDGAITLNTGAALDGRALSISGAIALTTNVITSNCYPLISLPNNTIPTFVPPGDITECVENIFTAVYNSATIDINPDRPDFYNLLNTDKRLDLNTASFIDNPDSPGCTFEIRWKIDMNDGTQIPALPALYNTGQPSAFGNLHFLGDAIGDGTNFVEITHTITYWIVDCAGHLSLPQTRTITIKPRPYIKKMTL